MLPLSAGSFNVTQLNLSAALRSAGSTGLYLGFSATHCSYCSVHEPEYQSYAQLALSRAEVSGGALPLLARVDGEREQLLVRRHEVRA